MTDLIIHGHFYQPPRENPWTGEVEQEIGASPYHDWNERIYAECYRPNAFAQIAGSEKSLLVVNNYEKISFNFGPTLLSWLERHHPETYQKILDADKKSAPGRGGHGNAIAQAYGHAILPLCNDRDRVTQVRWGMADFRHRFGRIPESLWLPETACDDKTLSLLIDEGIRFVILAPDQAEAYRTTPEGEWQSVADGSIDTSRAFRFSHTDGSGRSIAIFFYNGILARAIAFEQALVSSQVLVRLFKAAALGSRLVNVATDGETYGHHFKFGDLCLAHTLEIEAPKAGFRITNYADYLDRHGAEYEVEIKKGPDGLGTSWSCAHGVRRWSSDCGCHTGGEPGWNQKWRAPLRAALNYLRDEAAKEFETLGSEHFLDPWAARNAYIEVILDAGVSRAEFLNRHARRPLSPSEQVRALILLEIQRYSLLMFTSCGWFFSDISGIETIQIMKYAARVMELSEELGLPSARARFLEILSEAKSNRGEMGTGADVFLKYAQRQIVPA